MCDAGLADDSEARQVEALIRLFDGIFAERYTTRLVRGDDEPIYLPRDDCTSYHRIVFAHGFFASGLHEISHWCIAGPARRQQEDFGYWYLPDGRNEEQQDAFERAEVEPQAVELILTEACGRRFNVSVDNLDPNVNVDRYAFHDKVAARARERRAAGLPPRIEALRVALEAHFKQALPLAEAIHRADEVFRRLGTPA